MHKKLQPGRIFLVQPENCIERSVEFQSDVRRHLDQEAKRTGRSIDSLLDEMIRNDLALNGG